jgi:hypothetical protein
MPALSLYLKIWSIMAAPAAIYAGYSYL